MSESERSAVESSGKATSFEELHGRRWLVTARADNTKQAPMEIRGNQFSSIIGTILALLTIAGTFLLLVNPRFEDVNRSIGSLDSRIANLESRITVIETNLTKLDGKLDAIGSMFLVAYDDEELASAEISAIWQQVSD